MLCSKCGAENPDGKKFCGDCGAALENRCTQCGADNPTGKRFCGDCGAALPAPSTRTQSSSPARPTAEVHAPSAPSGGIASTDGERRHLTVLFSDLVDSTEIATHLDAEDWREIAAQYQRTAATAVTRFGGHVAKYLGDGLMVYFGWPEAQEDDAERAVRAGLAIVEDVDRLNERLAAEHRVKLSVRVAIHAGSVVMGHGGSAETDVFGDVPNVASRVQSAAEPDSVLITPAVHELVSGLFVVEDCGAHQLKGIERPLQLYRAIRHTVARRRTRNAAVHAPTPFVGREDEMGLLLGCWERAREGLGQLVLVVGEPGIGKSRLVEEFQVRIKDEPHLWVECAGEKFFQSTPFHAVTQILNQGLAWRGDESLGERVDQLERRLGLAGLKLTEAVPLIVELLTLPIPEKYPALTSAPDQRRKRLLANLAAWVLNTARVQPGVVAIEDLHWVDPSTLELTQILVEQAATAPLLLLYTTRPEFRAPWPTRTHHTQITLNRLNRRHTREMVATVVARAALGQDLIDTLVDRTDGVPLFAEELTRLILEGDGRSVAHEIPATLQDSLRARLDRLGPAKEIAHVAAVIGREFSYELLRGVAPTSEVELRSALQKLVDAELIYARGIAPEATYQFKHALIQDAAYEALLKTRRRQLHHRVAEIITEKFPALAESQPELLARHWTEASEAEPAISAWRKAATAADARHAFKEAEEGYRQARAVLKTLPESSERDARELDLSSVLVQVLQVTRGYTAPETIEEVRHTRALAEKNGNLTQLVMQGFGTWAAANTSADFPRAAALADQILDLAQREGSPSCLAFAHQARLQARFYGGELLAAEEHFARFSSCVEAASGFRQLPAAIVISMGYASLRAWMLGRADLARERMAQAVSFARDTKNPYDLAFGLFFESWLYRWLREPQRVEAAAGQVLAISEKNGFPYCIHLVRHCMGWALAELGKTGEGISLIRQGLVGMADVGARVSITGLLSCLAEAQSLDRRNDEALSTIEDTFQANPHELPYRPHMLVFRGILRLKLCQYEPAEVDFREAIMVAEKMGAKPFELRATTSLARLLRDTGRRDEARTMLSNIYNWFTEGFDTADLKDAKALLIDLSHSS
jgi:class 3 adenylate cyclase/tetratricopeptide (TPR) repeat protein